MNFYFKSPVFKAFSICSEHPKPVDKCIAILSLSSEVFYVSIPASLSASSTIALLPLNNTEWPNEVYEAFSLKSSGRGAPILHINGKSKFIFLIALFPYSNAYQLLFTPTPKGLIVPRPVTTTLFKAHILSFNLLFLLF